MWVLHWQGKQRIDLNCHSINMPQDSAIQQSDPAYKQPGWIERAKATADAETRCQPWKKIMEGREVDKGFEGKDVKEVRAEAYLYCSLVLEQSSRRRIGRHFL